MSILIRGGTVYDGECFEPQCVDLRVRGDVIAELGAVLDPGDSDVIDANGLIVCPGLIDLHVHVLDGVGIYSIPPAAAGLRTGVTTLLDAGSAGALTCEVLHRHIIPGAEEDIYALVHVSQLGVQGHPDVEPFFGELFDRRLVHAESCVQAIHRGDGRLLGVKVRLTADLADDCRENELAGMTGALEAATRCGGFCMFHHKDSGISLEEALSSLRPGDVYSHCFHGGGQSPFAADGAPLPVALEARQRGVIFDVGHGVGSFAWRVAERACCEHGFWPDTISTDLHRFSLHGPVYDMPTTMSKFLHLGMGLGEVIHRATLAPARVMGLDDRVGKLAVGMEADIALLRLLEGGHRLVDVEGATRTARQRLIPVKVFKGGRPFECCPAEDVEPV